MTSECTHENAYFNMRETLSGWIGVQVCPTCRAVESTFAENRLTGARQGYMTPKQRESGEWAFKAEWIIPAYPANRHRERWYRF